MLQRFVQQFLRLESRSSIILIVMMMIAMIWTNSPLAFIHQKFLESFLFWINEGLMTLFFLIVGLELKRGFLEGQLSTPSQIALPACAAFGGMLIPALIYFIINYHHPDTLKGWATPVATDIAFAIGVLSLFGRSVPPALKLFLLALAIFDDIGAILIIVFFYTHTLSAFWLVQSLFVVVILFLLNRFFVLSLFPYLLVGIVLWFCILFSGVHPTLTGIILALMIPNMAENPALSPLHRIEKLLHPWVAYFVMPLFALANAGISFAGLSINILKHSVVLGITLGLFLGKQIGVFSFASAMIHSRLAKLPEETSWQALYGVAMLCGIGFTMSLFLGTLSFQTENMYLAEVRLGVLAGSILSGLTGALVLFMAFARKKTSS